MITTDAPVTYDEPVDYGIHGFCQKCQVCVNRCPGRALVRERVWWRGAEKNKLIYDRCRPVMAKYEGCAVCMKVCPIQKFGMPAVMSHYVETGEVLGKGTDELEGYTLHDKGYFGPGELPHFDRSFFEFPHGRRENWLFEEFKKRLANDETPFDGGPSGLRRRSETGDGQEPHHPRRVAQARHIRSESADSCEQATRPQSSPWRVESTRGNRSTGPLFSSIQYLHRLRMENRKWSLTPRLTSSATAAP